jgi:SEC-C motif-containing protein
MRSRYSAYVLGLADYLLQTWHKDTRPTAFDLKDDQTKWLGLSILRTEITGTETAIVEFIARYKLGGHRAECLHETSVFIYTDAWYYVTGELT